MGWSRPRHDPTGQPAAARDSGRRLPSSPDDRPLGRTEEATELRTRSEQHLPQAREFRRSEFRRNERPTQPSGTTILVPQARCHRPSALNEAPPAQPAWHARSTFASNFDCQPSMRAGIRPGGRTQARRAEAPCHSSSVGYHPSAAQPDPSLQPPSLSSPARDHEHYNHARTSARSGRTSRSAHWSPWQARTVGDHTTHGSIDPRHAPDNGALWQNDSHLPSFRRNGQSGEDRTINIQLR